MDSHPHHHHHQIAKSVQNLLQIVDLNYRLRWRSLPNIIIPTTDHHHDCEYYHHPSEFNPACSSTSTKNKNSHKILKKTWDKVKTAIIHTTTSHSNRRTSLNKASKLDSSSKNLPPTCSAPSTPLQKQTFDFDNPTLISSPSVSPPTNFLLRSVSANAGEMTTDATEHVPNLEEESQKIQQSYANLQKRLSQELHQRMSEHRPDTNKTAIDNLSEDFKKRLRQWEMWKFISTGKVTYTDEELQQILPEDFSQRLHEWENIKHMSKTPDSMRETSSPEKITPCKNKLLRKKKSSASISTSVAKGEEASSSSSSSSRQKELAWLEKQLEKIEAEKKRLEREMKKNMEREARLEKMKEALQNTRRSEEVWIRTPTAKCKVEKLTEKFTKKLYEWEEMRGIQPESSTMALLHPKYYGPPPEEGEGAEEEMEARVRAEFAKTRYDDDTPARDSESRRDENEEEEEEGGTTEHEDNYDEHDKPRLLLNEQEQRISSASSSSDFEEATDSFATHEKANSGASNTTDSDFYRAEFPTSCRRRSSEPISTPLSARSPSLSAFTSDDEVETCGLLKTVSEENESIMGNNTMSKDAESQTEIILKAKPVLVEDDEENEENLGGEESGGIFVQTKRTIFTPILDEVDSEEKVVLIEGGDSLKSPSLIRKVVQQSHPLEVRTVSPIRDNILPADFLPCFSSSSNSFSFAPKPGRTSPPSPPGGKLATTLLPRPPRVVEMIPKVPPHASTSQTMGQKSFPKMGKIPIWCSPLGTRHHLGGGSIGGDGGHASEADLTSKQHSSSVDFSGTFLLTEANLYDNHSSSTVPCSSTSLVMGTSNPPPSKIPYSKTGVKRGNITGVVVPEESGIVGASIQTGQRHPAFLPVRSNSFRIHRNMMGDQPGGDGNGSSSSAAAMTSRPRETGSGATKGGFYAHLKSRVGGTVSKSRSTGYIRSKFDKALSSFTSKITSKEHGHGSPTTTNPTGERNQLPQ